MPTRSPCPCTAAVVVLLLSSAAHAMVGSPSSHPCTAGCATCTDRDGQDWDLSALAGTLGPITAGAWEYHLDLCADVSAGGRCEGADVPENSQVFRLNPLSSACQVLAASFDEFDEDHPTTLEPLDGPDEGVRFMMSADITFYKYTITIELVCDWGAGIGTPELVPGSPINDPVFSWPTEHACDGEPPAPPPPAEPEPGSDGVGGLPVWAVFSVLGLGGISLVAAGFVAKRRGGADGSDGSVIAVESDDTGTASSQKHGRRKRDRKGRKRRQEYTALPHIRDPVPVGASFEEQLVYNRWLRARAHGSSSGSGAHSDGASDDVSMSSPGRDRTKAGARTSSTKPRPVLKPRPSADCAVLAVAKQTFSRGVTGTPPSGSTISAS